MPLVEAITSMMATIGTRKLTPKCPKKPEKACITPAVRLSCCAGITHEIASVGRMKITSTSPIAGTSPSGTQSRAP